ncbi:MAG: carboxypeptidase regulatory-like domain-containing protein, partial [Anaerolineae bacterium]|nr:carboxypeptidase regulatory-like domain-containing protein [Anaerolineae bacterium]
WNQVSELDEEDNDYGPIVVEVSEEGTPPPPPPTGTGSIAGETWVSLTGIPVPHGRANVWCVDGAGDVVASTASDDEGRYELLDLTPGTYTVLSETWIDGALYSGTVADVEVVENETTVAIIIMYEH